MYGTYVRFVFGYLLSSLAPAVSVFLVASFLATVTAMEIAKTHTSFFTFSSSSKDTC